MAGCQATAGGIESEKHNKALYLRILDSLAMVGAPMAMPDIGQCSEEQQMMLMAAMNQGGDAQMFPETNLISIPDFVGSSRPHRVNSRTRYPNSGGCYETPLRPAMCWTNSSLSCKPIRR